MTEKISEGLVQADASAGASSEKFNGAPEPQRFPIEVGKYPNGDTFVRVRLSANEYHGRIEATVEGSGKDADRATDLLQLFMRRLADDASDAADAMEI